ncbi:MAG: hypothetical protein A2Z34_08425 [Planctomycetes bacterium RBG_16_59_8]|nr:MAG: hypothetical protein A2Z34_08425 [Planctomycetes bacterium RBG_16_59_8]
MPQTHSFTLKSKGGLLRVLITDVSISAPFAHATPKQKKYKAIWDTGATNSLVTQKVADELGLQPVSMVLVHHAHGQSESNVYLVNIVLPNNVVFKNVHVTEGILSDGVDVLVGMDIINCGDFAVTNGDGNTTFSFRCPSVASIDFVKQSEARQQLRDTDNVPRNDPCPCGSGKKFKKCCGKR